MGVPLSAVKYDEDKLAAYHTAYFNNGAVLYVPDNVELTNRLKEHQDSESVFAGTSAYFWLSQAEAFQVIRNAWKQQALFQQLYQHITAMQLAQAGAQIKSSAIDRLGE